METFHINVKPSECAANNRDIKIKKSGRKGEKAKGKSRNFDRASEAAI